MKIKKAKYKIGDFVLTKLHHLECNGYITAIRYKRNGMPVYSLDYYIDYGRKMWAFSNERPEDKIIEKIKGWAKK